MLYKGGPKNYSRKDWQFLLVIIAITVGVGLIFGGGKVSSTGRTVSSINSASGEFRGAAERNGYKGEEAEQVAAAAEKLCAATGDC